MGLFWNLEEFSGNRGNKIKWIEERYKEETKFRKVFYVKLLFGEKGRKQEKRITKRERPPIINTKVRVRLSFSDLKSIILKLDLSCELFLIWD